MAEKKTAQEESAPPPLPNVFGRHGPHMPSAGQKERAQDRRGTLQRLWGYLRRQRLALILTTTMVIASAGLNLLGPYLLGLAIDQYIIPGDLPGLVGICGLMLAVHASISLLTYLQSYVMAAASQRTVRDIRNDLFDQMQELSLRFFDKRSHGDLMSRLTNDVENINMVLSESVTQLVSGLISLVGVAGIMLWINPRLAVISLVTVPSMMLLLTRWIASHTKEGFRRQQSSLGALNGLIEETITGQRVVKTYVREETVIADFDAANATLRQHASYAQVYAGFMGPVMNFVGNLGLAIIVGIGGWMALQNLATVGVIASFINYTRQFSRPLNEIANLYNTIQAAIAGTERVFEIIDQTPELIDDPNALPLPAVRGDVVFEDVSFAYEEGTPVLKQVNLHAQPGQIMALVGPTGAGKTTIVNLLTRFYDIDSGRICIDGVDIRHLRKDDLRRQLGIVLQDTFLFSDTVMENIRYGRLDASDEEVIGAATVANANSFIHRLPHGYATLLSERGSNLSQGQRQLLSIARAILADPGILILDEATSSVDTRTEKHIQEAMLRLMSGRTSFVIAHRLSTIREADQILVINHGELIERGTHHELLAAGGFYQRLYQSQFRATERRPIQREFVSASPNHPITQSPDPAME